MDVRAKIDEIAAEVEGARAMPMSASCIVNRGELLEMLEELRQLLPVELREANELLRSRDAVLAAGRTEADQIIAAGERERARLVTTTEVAAAAEREAERLVTEARYEVERMHREVDEYVDAKLAHFEIMLQKTMTAVARGRDKLREELAGLSPAAPDSDDEPDSNPPSPGGQN